MWQYRIEFVIFPLIVALTASLTCRSWKWIGGLAFGVVLFTFIEYWAHRWFLHEIYWHANHQRHHTHPEEIVVFPWWYAPAFIGGFFLALPYSIFAGVMLGYCWFLAWHHVLHHQDLTHRPWARAYARWHDLHHQGQPVNYGITHPLWDVAFGTYQRS